MHVLTPSISSAGYKCFRILALVTQPHCIFGQSFHCVMQCGKWNNTIVNTLPDKEPDAIFSEVEEHSLTKSREERCEQTKHAFQGNAPKC